MGLKEKIDLMETEISLLRDKVSRLEHERKELEIENIEIKKENKRLKLKYIDTANYEQWEYEEIVQWILSLNKEMFSEYKGTLIDALKEESVNGQCLREVEVADIKRWGIKNFMHSKTLLKHIQNLVSNVANEEG